MTGLFESTQIMVADIILDNGDSSELALLKRADLDFWHQTSLTVRRLLTRRSTGW